MSALTRSDLYGQHAADVEVLAGLRLDAFVSSDDQQHQVDAADSCQHVADEALVAGDVDESNADGLACGAGQIEVRKSDIDRDAAPLLFFQSIGISAGQRPHQSTLSVVDVAGGANDDGLHAEQFIWNSWNSRRADTECFKGEAMRE
jgi:hypothetical protein